MPKRGICVCFCLIVFFNDTATTEIYTLSLHDALPILPTRAATTRLCRSSALPPRAISSTDRKSTRLNSSHLGSSYAVFCLKKKTIRFDNTVLQKKALYTTSNLFVQFAS